MLWIIIQNYLIYFGAQIVPVLVLVFLGAMADLTMGQAICTMSTEPLVMQQNAQKQPDHNPTVKRHIKGPQPGDSERLTLLKPL